MVFRNLNKLLNLLSKKIKRALPFLCKKESKSDDLITTRPALACPSVAVQQPPLLEPKGTFTLDAQGAYTSVDKPNACVSVALACDRTFATQLRQQLQNGKFFKAFRLTDLLSGRASATLTDKVGQSTCNAAMLGYIRGGLLQFCPLTFFHNWLRIFFKRPLWSRLLYGKHHSAIVPFSLYTGEQTIYIVAPVHRLHGDYFNETSDALIQPFDRGNMVDAELITFTKGTSYSLPERFVDLLGLDTLPRYLYYPIRTRVAALERRGSSGFEWFEKSLCQSDALAGMVYTIDLAFYNLLWKARLDCYDFNFLQTMLLLHRNRRMPLTVNGRLLRLKRLSEQYGFVFGSASRQMQFWRSQFATPTEQLYDTLEPEFASHLTFGESVRAVQVETIAQLASMGLFFEESAQAERHFMLRAFLTDSYRFDVEVNPTIMLDRSDESTFKPGLHWAQALDNEYDSRFSLGYTTAGILDPVYGQLYVDDDYGDDMQVLDLNAEREVLPSLKTDMPLRTRGSVKKPFYFSYDGMLSFFNEETGVHPGGFEMSRKLARVYRCDISSRFAYRRRFRRATWAFWAGAYIRRFCFFYTHVHMRALHNHGLRHFWHIYSPWFHLTAEARELAKIKADTRYHISEAFMERIDVRRAGEQYECMHHYELFMGAAIKQGLLVHAWRGPFFLLHLLASFLRRAVKLPSRRYFYDTFMMYWLHHPFSIVKWSFPLGPGAYIGYFIDYEEAWPQWFWAWKAWWNSLAEWSDSWYLPSWEYPTHAQMRSALDPLMIIHDAMLNAFLPSRIYEEVTFLSLMDHVYDNFWLRLLNVNTDVLDTDIIMFHCWSYHVDDFIVDTINIGMWAYDLITDDMLYMSPFFSFISFDEMFYYLSVCGVVPLAVFLTVFAADVLGGEWRYRPAAFPVEMDAELCSADEVTANRRTLYWDLEAQKEVQKLTVPLAARVWRRITSELNGGFFTYALLSHEAHDTLDEDDDHPASYDGFYNDPDAEIFAISDRIDNITGECVYYSDVKRAVRREARWLRLEGRFAEAKRFSKVPYLRPFSIVSLSNGEFWLGTYMWDPVTSEYIAVVDQGADEHQEDEDCWPLVMYEDNVEAEMADDTEEPGLHHLEWKRYAVFNTFFEWRKYRAFRRHYQEVHQVGERSFFGRLCNAFPSYFKRRFRQVFGWLLRYRKVRVPAYAVRLSKDRPLAPFRPGRIARAFSKLGRLWYWFQVKWARLLAFIQQLIWRFFDWRMEKKEQFVNWCYERFVRVARWCGFKRFGETKERGAEDLKRGATNATAKGAEEKKK